MYLFAIGILAIVGIILGIVGTKDKAPFWLGVGIICEGLAILILVGERIVK